MLVPPIKLRAWPFPSFEPFSVSMAVSETGDVWTPMYAKKLNVEAALMKAMHSCLAPVEDLFSMGLKR